MKIIDRTPFKDADGKISPMDRVRATMKYGTSWISDVEAQEATAAVLGRQLDRGYTLLLNPQLPGTDVILPMVLVGPPGVFMIYMTNERGVFQARGEDWGSLDGERFVPAKVNLLTRSARMAQALGKFLSTQGVTLAVEPVLLTTNPGMHVDSMRPLIRVVMSDGVERFAIGLTQGNRLLSPESVAAICDRILTPRTPAKTASAPPPAPAARGEAPAGDASLIAEPSGSMFAEEPGPPARPATPVPAPAAQKPAAGSPQRGGVRFSRGQWAALGCLLVIFVLVLVTFIVLAVMNV